MLRGQENASDYAQAWIPLDLRPVHDLSSAKGGGCLFPGVVGAQEFAAVRQTERTFSRRDDTTRTKQQRNQNGTRSLPTSDVQYCRVLCAETSEFLLSGDD
jgi:hypothetical protein